MFASTLSSPLRALSSRNYRLYFCGQAVSSIGTWMAYTATIWYIYHLTSSALSVGLFGFVSQIPNFLLGPVAGMWVDRLDRRRILMCTQVLGAFQAFGMSWLALTDNLSQPSLLTFAALQGVCNAFEWPARAALLINCVENKDQLANAIALNSSMFNLARFVGSALAGLVIAAWGPASCYLVDGITYGAMILSLLFIRVPPFVASVEYKRPVSDLRDGMRYVWNRPPILVVLQLVTVISFFGSSYYVLLPQLAREVVGGDARTLGVLLAASSFGALAAAFYLSMRLSARGLGRLIVAGGSLLSVALFTLPWIAILPIVLVCMFCLGLGSVLVFVSCNTTIQSLVSDDKRGRVSALFTMAFTGTTPFASLLIGIVAQRLGSSTALAAASLFCFAATVRYHRARPGIRAAMEEVRHTFSNVSPIRGAVASSN